MAKTVAKGIYYVVRSPNRWQLLTLPFKPGEDIGHYDWFPEFVAGQIAKQWAKRLGKPAKAIEQDVSKLCYGFPRGRVSQRGKGEYLILHGADLDPSMKVGKSEISSAFGLSGRIRLQFDEHEQCQELDKGEMRRVLRIREDWKAV